MHTEACASLLRVAGDSEMWETVSFQTLRNALFVPESLEAGAAPLLHQHIPSN